MASEVNLETILEHLEDTDFNTFASRSKDYQCIKEVFDAKGSINVNRVDRLMVIIEEDLKNKDTRIVSALSALVSIVEKVKIGECTPQPELKPSALAILNVLEDMANINTVETVKQVLFRALSCYPDSVLLQAYMSCRDLMKGVVLNYAFMKTIIHDMEMPVQFFTRLLTILPADEKKMFVEDHLDLWFYKIIPMTVELALEEGPHFNVYIEAVEIITEVLVHFEYETNPAWHSLFICIYNPNNYPSILKKMIDKSQESWYRLWIIFVKLLKENITRQKHEGRSPINALLSVVENAFKLRTEDRCRAFKCWCVLINNFSKEQNEYQVQKRVRLLMIPLKSNNAKTESTAVVKLNTWWHLIRSFEDRLEKFIDLILLPLLHFCYGEHGANIVPTTFSLVSIRGVALKKLSVEMFVEMAGHLNCEGCAKVPRLTKRIINLKLLVDYWKDWLYSLSSAIKMAVQVNDDAMKQCVSCMWKNFLLTVCELPRNNIRKDLFNDLLNIVEQLAKEFSINYGFADITISVLVKSIFEEDNIRKLLQDKDPTTGPLHIILSVILDPSLNDYYKRKTFEEIMSLFKLITNFIVAEFENPCPPRILGWNVKDMIPNDNTIIFWTALVETLCEVNCGNTGGFNLSNLLMWPMRNMTKFTNARAEFAWYRWHTLYELLHIKALKDNLCIDGELLNILSIHHETTETPVYFQMIAALTLLKQDLVNVNGFGYEKPAEIVIEIIDNEYNLQYVEKMIPVIVDVLAVYVSYVTDIENVVLAKFIVAAMKALLRSSMRLLNLHKINAHHMTLFENLLKNFDTMLQVHAYFPLMDIIQDQLLEYLHYIPSVKESLSTHLKTLLNICEQIEPESKEMQAVSPNENMSNKNDLKPIKQDLVANVCNKDDFKRINKVDSVANISHNDDLKQIQNEAISKYFTAPNSNSKTLYKKQPNIVNTVMENGEEYVVVKSNWKFNPKKLTENQKEKLRKKRQDIPALYQDLSQSQDEFKITAWKLDSQDSSTTSSISASKSACDDVSTILNNTLHSEVVPNVMGTIFADTAINTVKDGGEKGCKDGSPKQTPAVKDPKTPRLALKDRVFKNVRHLMEKSSLRNENEVFNELNKTIGYINNSPNAKTNIKEDTVNSAPSKINCERPSRVIKKPKKFEYTKVFALKKRRLVETDSQSGIPELLDLPEEQLDRIEIIKEIENIDDNEIIPIPPTPSIEKEINAVEKELVSDSTENALLNAMETEQIIEKCKKISEETCTIHKSDIKIDVDTSVPDIVTTNEGQDKNQDDVKADNSLKISTPKSTTKTKVDQSSVKKKTSRIEKQLMIDMVEGHPLLQARTEKRFTRKHINSATVVKRKSLAEKINRIHYKGVVKTERKAKEKIKPKLTTETSGPLIVIESQDRLSGSSDDLPASEDIIESSQDSSITIIPVKSPKNSAKKVAVVKLNKLKEMKSLLNTSESQRLLNDSNNQIISLIDTASPPAESIIVTPPINNIPGVKVDKSTANAAYRQTSAVDDFNNDVMLLNDCITSQHETIDISLPKNITMLEEKTELELTENMDTQLFEGKDGSSDVIINNDDEALVVFVCAEELPPVEADTQATVEADTEPINLDSEIRITTQDNVLDTEIENGILRNDEEKVTTMTEGDLTPIILETFEAPLTNLVEPNNACSPLKDATEKKKDFLNDTIEISPIKTLSPVREEKISSLETNANYVVIKLTSPVQSNGEPFNENCDSPEMFTEDKLSPDKRDQSPPRIEVPVTNTSPSSSLLLKKNRLKVRSSGRAAQMLGLCAPDKLKAILNSDKSVESEESKKSSRRNLRILYNGLDDSDYHADNDNQVNECDQVESFLNFNRILPCADSSPAGPILKRKLVDIADEATVSPASKRKRVSFHDPPVSTMVSIQKYIEPLGIRSPQRLTLKQMRTHNNLKSPKRLDDVFKLNTVLTKASESFSDDANMVSDDTEMSSVDQTPAVEVIKTSELNDTDPICPDLMDCKDSIVEIAEELSSPAMKNLLIKELEGKVESIADLAKMTEVEVNRLCIKAPKVEVVAKVLVDYFVKKGLVDKVTKNVEQGTAENTMEQENSHNRIIDRTVDVQLTPDLNQAENKEVQTSQLDTCDMALQTDVVPVPVVRFIHTQTNITPVLEASVQTIDTGFKSTKDVIASCLSERSNFVEELAKQLEESSVRQIAGSLPTSAVLDLLTKNVTESDTTVLSFVQNHLLERFDSNDLILFCSQLLQKLHVQRNE